MAIIDIFSKRQKRIRGEVPDVYVYDKLPGQLRVQLVQIIRDGLSTQDDRRHQPDESASEFLHETLCREYGVFTLHAESRTNWEAIANYLLSSENTEHVIDVVELSLRFIDVWVRGKSSDWQFRPKTSPGDTISEVNQRFREHGVGYEFASGDIIRIDSQLLHSEVVKPTLALLSDEQFEGANDEFLKAHEHYRHGRYKECLTDCLKAFESTMKSICVAKHWPYAPTDTAKKLIEICMDNGLFSTFMQTHLGSLRSILESGIPTVRNKQSGHGQGPSVTNVTEATARFALHTTATNILFFIESSKTP